jgi:hypothetical protein
LLQSFYSLYALILRVKIRQLILLFAYRPCLNQGHLRRSAVPAGPLGLTISSEQTNNLYCLATIDQEIKMPKIRHDSEIGEPGRGVAGRRTVTPAEPAGRRPPPASESDS